MRSPVSKGSGMPSTSHSGGADEMHLAPAGRAQQMVRRQRRAAHEAARRHDQVGAGGKPRRAARRAARCSVSSVAGSGHRRRSHDWSSRSGTGSCAAPAVAGIALRRHGMTAVAPTLAADVASDHDIFDRALLVARRDRVAAGAPGTSSCWRAWPTISSSGSAAMQPRVSGRARPRRPSRPARAGGCGRCRASRR